MKKQENGKTWWREELVCELLDDEGVLVEPTASEPEPLSPPPTHTHLSPPMQTKRGVWRWLNALRTRSGLRIATAVMLVVWLAGANGWLLWENSSPLAHSAEKSVKKFTSGSADASGSSSAPTQTSFAGDGSDAGTNTALTVLVDVHGDVQHPGVYRLPSDARIGDAVKAAGGYRNADDVNQVNSAAPVNDGQELVIPGPLDVQPSSQNSSGGGLAQLGVQSASKSINLNTADSATLETLPGIGPARAQAILSYRTAHGAFTDIQQLRNIPGIGEKTLAKISPYLEVASATDGQKR